MIGTAVLHFSCFCDMNYFSAQLPILPLTVTLKFCYTIENTRITNPFLEIEVMAEISLAVELGSYRQMR